LRFRLPALRAAADALAAIRKSRRGSSSLSAFDPVFDVTRANLMVAP